MGDVGAWVGGPRTSMAGRRWVDVVSGSAASGSVTTLPPLVVEGRTSKLFWIFLLNDGPPLEDDGRKVLEGRIVPRWLFLPSMMT